MLLKRYFYPKRSMYAATANTQRWRKPPCKARAQRKVAKPPAFANFACLNAQNVVGSVVCSLRAYIEKEVKVRAKVKTNAREVVGEAKCSLCQACP